MIRPIALAALLLATPALAQMPPAAPGPDMAGHMDAPKPADTPATAAYKRSMEKMMAGMEVPYTGDPDRDFVAGMLPHHMGAVDMAKIEMQYGHDPELKQLAHDIVVAQDKEIIFMRRWQMQHPPKP